jgi:hypothetical protein
MMAVLVVFGVVYSSSLFYRLDGYKQTLPNGCLLEMTAPWTPVGATSHGQHIFLAPQCGNTLQQL